MVNQWNGVKRRKSGLGIKGKCDTTYGMFTVSADLGRPPPPIEGTGIVLGTEEDIAKWIAERKAKWPSAKRVAERVSFSRQASSLY